MSVLEALTRIGRWGRDLPIRWKLMVLITVSSSLGLVVAGGVTWFDGSRQIRSQMLDTCTTMAEIAAANVQTALVFGDTGDASEVLASLRAESSFAEARVFHADGRAFVATGRDVDAPPLEPLSTMPIREPGHVFLEDRLLVVTPVELDGTVEGWLLLSADTHDLRDRKSVV